MKRSGRKADRFLKRFFAFYYEFCSKPVPVATELFSIWDWQSYCWNLKLTCTTATKSAMTDSASCAIFKNNTMRSLRSLSTSLSRRSIGSGWWAQCYALPPGGFIVSSECRILTTFLKARQVFSQENITVTAAVRTKTGPQSQLL